MSKRYQEFYFFEITNAEAFKPSLGKLADKVITTSKGALDNRKAICEAKKLGSKKDVGLVGVNIAFTRKGMDKVSLRVYFYTCGSQR